MRSSSSCRTSSSKQHGDAAFSGHARSLRARQRNGSLPQGMPVRLDEITKR
jgi:hypothetical protein